MYAYILSERGHFENTRIYREVDASRASTQAPALAICSNAASIARVCATTSQPGSARNRPRSARFNCRSARRSAAMQRAMRT